MSTIIKAKRSAVPGKVPLTTDLELGEFAINTFDGKLFIKKNASGTESIVDVTAGGVPPTLDSVTATGNTTSNSITVGSATINADLNIADKIVHNSDTNTAIRFPSADTVTVETNGVERLRVDSSGNVGIGTTAPEANLDVSGETSTNTLNVKDLLKLPRVSQDTINSLEGNVPIGSLVQNVSTGSVNLYDGVSWVALVVAGTWTPDNLFSSSEPGIWLDPSDLTTLFQDTAGTTSVTAPGQPVGLVLDKSRGLTLGPELVTNGDFSNGITGWTAVSSATLSVSGGSLVVTNGAAAFGYAYQLVNTVVGKTYTVTFTVTGGTSSGSLYVGTTPGGFENYNSPPRTVGVYTVSFLATATTTSIRFGPVSNTISATFALDNISVRELPGNHATQSILASRPTYGIVPRTGRRNLLTGTEQFDDDAIWYKGTGGTIVANSVADPNGNLTADAYTWATSSMSYAYLSQLISSTSTLAHTFSIWLKRPAGSGSRKVRLTISDATVSTVNSTDFTVTESWQRFSFTRASPNSTGLVGVGLSLAGSLSIAAGEILHVWGAQLEAASTATAYQRVGSQFDVTEAGVPSLSYLSFDGVDDFLVTPTITPGTDKVQVFAGVRKLSDAAIGMVCEFSPNVNTNNGTFWLAAPVGAGVANYDFASKGTVGQSRTRAGFSAPITNVLTGIGDIGGDVSNLRVNGSDIGVTTADQGTGNYLAYPLYIGRRDGTSLSFNGHIYGLITRFGSNLDTSTIQKAERWLNLRTGAF